MYRRTTLLFIGFLLFASQAVAQTSLANGGFELWRLKQFKCCGRNVDSPWDWGMAENLCGINYNKFVFRITDTVNVHSGIASAMLYSDTTWLNNLVLIPGMLSYGGLVDSASTAVTIGPVVRPAGFPINSNPSQLNFYMKMNHAETDTPSYVYLFTKWNIAGQKEDTLAYANADIPDIVENMNQWVSYTDTIKYLMPGTPDTVRLIFFGGRFGDSNRKGNATYLDDVSFYYPTTGLVSLDGEPILQLYPNPASTTLTIKTGQYKAGNKFQIFDAMGRIVSAVSIEIYSTIIDISAFEAGEYFYRLADKNNAMQTQGKFTITK